LRHGLKRAEAGQQAAEQVQGRDRWVADERHHRQPARTQHQAELIEQQQPPAIHAVRDCAPQQRHGDERHELDGAEQSDEQRGSGLNVELVGERDECRLRAQARDQGPDHHQAEVMARAERRKVGPEPRKPHGGAG